MVRIVIMRCDVGSPVKNLLRCGIKNAWEPSKVGEGLQVADGTVYYECTLDRRGHTLSSPCARMATRNDEQRVIWFQGELKTWQNGTNE